MSKIDNNNPILWPVGHMVVLYYKDKEIVDILIDYLVNSLKENKRCLYITGDTDTKVIISGLKLLIDYDGYIYKKQLQILDKSDVYSKSGTFNPDQMVALLIDESNNAIKDGYSGLAVTGEISWVLNYDDGFEKIMDYEWKLNDLVFKKHPVSSVCRYNLNKFTDEMIINIIQVHPFLIWKNRLHENPFYVPVDRLKLKQIKKYQVKSWLENISKFTNTKSEFNIELEKKKQELIESEEEFKYIFNNSSVGKSLTGINGELKVNKTFCNMLGYTKEEIEGINWETLTHPDDIEISRIAVKKLIDGDENTVRFSKRYIKKDGSVLWADVHTSIRRDSSGEPIYFMTSVIDITARQRATELLQKKEEEQRLLLDELQIGIIVHSTDSSVLFANSLAVDILGISGEEMQGKKAADKYWHFVDEKGKTLSIEKYPVSIVLENKKALKDYMMGVKFENTEDIKWLVVNGIPIFNEKHEIERVVTSFTDVTDNIRKEEKRLQVESHLRNRQRLESIGNMAGGVAHEINNPINGIMNYGQIILDSEPNDKMIKEYAKEIIHESERISEIVRSLLGFSRISKQEHSYANINDIISQTLSLIKTVIRHDHINFRVNIKEDLPPIRCRSQQIQQVIMNLLTNAQDAVNQKYPDYNDNKIIHLSCDKIEADDRNWIEIVIEDHGTGIPADIIDNIFDPFFTTKTRDKGTGIGLSISYNIIKDHHGEIKVETELGKFTKFIVQLPCDNGWESTDKILE